MESPRKEEIEEFEKFIITINYLVVAKTREPSGVRPGDSIYFMIYDALYKKNKSKDWKDFAIALMWKIADRHPFLEGNKRTAFIVGKALLLALGNALLLCNEDDGLKQMRYLADCSKQKSYNGIRRWFLINSTELPNKNLTEFEAYLQNVNLDRRRLIKKYLKSFELLINGV